MESVQTFKIHIFEKLNAAEHLIGTTYQLVKEPKLLVSVIDNIYNAMDLTLSALVEHKRSFIDISEYNSSTESRMEFFQKKIMQEYALDASIIGFMSDLKKTLDVHKNSNVEFTKKDTFVMTDDDYNLTTLDEATVTKTLTDAKLYIEKLLIILDDSKNN